MLRTLAGRRLCVVRYLVREGSRAGDYSLTVHIGDRIQHFRIENSAAAGRLIIGARSFNSLGDLVCVLCLRCRFWFFSLPNTLTHSYTQTHEQTSALLLPICIRFLSVLHPCSMRVIMAVLLLGRAPRFRKAHA